MIKQESRAYFTALGSHVSALRKSRGMTQAELARAIGVSLQTVFAYELGDRRISVLVLAKLARIFSTPVGDLVGLSKPVRERKGGCLRVVRDMRSGYRRFRGRSSASSSGSSTCLKTATALGEVCDDTPTDHR